jgi:hypothetical protein
LATPYPTIFYVPFNNVLGASTIKSYKNALVSVVVCTLYRNMLRHINHSSSRQLRLTADAYLKFARRANLWGGSARPETPYPPVI